VNRPRKRDRQGGWDIPGVQGSGKVLKSRAGEADLLETPERPRKEERFRNLGDFIEDRSGRPLPAGKAVINLNLKEADRVGAQDPSRRARRRLIQDGGSASADGQRATPWKEVGVPSYSRSPASGIRHDRSQGRSASLRHPSRCSRQIFRSVSRRTHCVKLKKAEEGREGKKEGDPEVRRFHLPTSCLPYFILPDGPIAQRLEAAGS